MSRPEPDLQARSHEQQSMRNIVGWFNRKKKYITWLISALVGFILIASSAVILAKYGVIKGTSVIRDLSTIVALVVGGIWAYLAFFRERQRYPRATTCHSIRHWVLPTGMILIRVVVQIENIGKVLLSLEHVCCRVDRIMPWPDARSIKDTITSRDRDIAVMWPNLDYREKTFEKDKVQIEPGEKDELTFDMAVKEGASLVRIYTHLQNVFKIDKHVGWSNVTLYEMGGQMEDNGREIKEVPVEKQQEIEPYPVIEQQEIEPPPDAQEPEPPPEQQEEE